MADRELSLAIELARRAGAAVLEHYKDEILSEQKVGFDDRHEPVTEADREASRIIVAGIVDAFPNDGILSEEEEDDKSVRLASDRVWMIDPIDGTSGFIKKDGDFAIQIGLAERGEPVLGVVLLPAHDVLYFAKKGAGAYRARGSEPFERLVVSEKTEFSEMDIAVSRDHRSPKMGRIISELALRREVPRGSVGIKMGLIAERACDLYIHLSHRTKFWDTCGPQAILEEAGGRVTDLFGTPIRYDLENVVNLNGLVATNGTSHTAVIEQLGPILRKLGRSRLPIQDGPAIGTN